MLHDVVQRVIYAVAVVLMVSSVALVSGYRIALAWGPRYPRVSGHVVLRRNRLWP